MPLPKQYVQLLKVAGGINTLFLLLSFSFGIYLGLDHSEHVHLIWKIITFTLANSLCWLINLILLIWVVPVLSRRRIPRWITFYMTSYIAVFTVAIWLTNSSALRVISDEEKIDHPFSGPIFFILAINALSLVAIELILSRHADQNIKVENATMKAENAELKIKSLQAQHEKLKNQLHPHFLFNSLTALKSLIRKDPEMAESYLVKLAGFLRFSMSHNEQNVVSLEDELHFSLMYLEMQKVRFQDALNYTLEIDRQGLEYELLPVFSLQLALENAIKHNKLTAAMPLSIHIQRMSTDWLRVENNIRQKTHAEPASGVGLKNLSDRYKLLMEDDIKIENDADYFRVYLKIIRP